MWRNRVNFTALLNENRPRWQALADCFAEMGLVGPDGQLKAESVRNTWWRVRRDQASRQRRAPSPASAIVRPPPAATAPGATVIDPEDVGGADGYHNFPRSWRAREIPEHADIKRWCGGHFDPAWFDLELTEKDVRNALRPNARRRLYQPKPKRAKARR